MIKEVLTAEGSYSLANAEFELSQTLLQQMFAGRVSEEVHKLDLSTLEAALGRMATMDTVEEQAREKAA